MRAVLIAEMIIVAALVAGWRCKTRKASGARRAWNRK